MIRLFSQALIAQLSELSNLTLLQISIAKRTKYLIVSRILSIQLLHVSDVLSRVGSSLLRQAHRIELQLESALSYLLSGISQRLIQIFACSLIVFLQYGATACIVRCNT